MPLNRLHRRGMCTEPMGKPLTWLLLLACGWPASRQPGGSCSLAGHQLWLLWLKRVAATLFRSSDVDAIARTDRNSRQAGKRDLPSYCFLVSAKKSHLVAGVRKTRFSFLVDLKPEEG